MGYGFLIFALFAGHFFVQVLSEKFPYPGLFLIFFKDVFLVELLAFFLRGSANRPNHTIEFTAGLLVVLIFEEFDPFVVRG